MSRQAEAQVVQVITPLAIVAPDRTKFIGGSDIAAILGISPWRTAVQLWQDKITPRVEGPTTGVKKRGKRWESVVAEMLVEELERQGRKVEIVAANKRYTDPDVPVFACEIDFELRLDGSSDITNAELKTVHPFMAKEWGESGTDTAPIHYLAQGMWGLGITKRKHCIVGALFGADSLRVYPVDRDDETIAAMRLKAAKFWSDHVLTRIAPPPAVLADMDVLFPKESEAGALLADDELTEKVLRMRAIDREIKARQSEFDLLEFAVKRVMGDCPELCLPGDTTAATWKERSHTWLDQAALKETHPKIHKEFVRKASSRVFTLKPFGWKGT